MAWLIAGAGLALATGALAALVYLNVNGTRLRMRRIAETHGLAWDGSTFAGVVDGHEVRLRFGSGTTTLRVSLVPAVPLPPSLRMRRRTPQDGSDGTDIRRIGSAEDAFGVRVGHREFDELVWLAVAEGAVTRLLAALDFEAREQVYLAVQIGAVLSEGRLEAWLESPRHQDQAVSILAAAARALGRVGDPIEGLMRIVERDPVPAVRVRALEHLLRVTAVDPRWLAGLVDDVAVGGQTRFVAARSLGGDEGRRALVALVRQGDRWGGLAAAALSCDPTAPTFAEDLPLLEPALVAGLEATADPPVVEALGRIGTLVSIPAMNTAARRHPTARRDIERAVAAIQLRHGAEAGRLALVDSTSSGGLALAAGDPSGALSLRHDPPPS